MLIIADNRLPEPAIRNLSSIGEFIGFSTTGITYDSISGHPDIFICQTPTGLILAPNLPEYYLLRLKQAGIHLVQGKLPIGSRYPETARYNAVLTDKFLMHNPSCSDQSLLDYAGSHRLAILGHQQGYTRCNLVSLGDDSFLTSDKGIERCLLKNNLDVHFISPHGIILPGFDHGFLGGCCGMTGKSLVITGSLAHHPQGEAIRNIVQSKHLDIVELSDGPLFDCGGLFFIQNATGETHFE